MVVFFFAELDAFVIETVLYLSVSSFRNDCGFDSYSLGTLEVTMVVCC